MPSVGSTPTTTSPAPLHQQQQQPSYHPKLQHQHSLPLQLQFSYKQQVTTTQPSPAGTVSGHTVASFGDKVTNLSNNADDDPLSLSSTNSFSSVDTNQTLLNSIATQTHQASASGNRSSSIGTTNRSYRSKYSQFMIITPAVSIDRNFDNATGASAENDVDESYFNNGNIFRMTLLQSSIDSGNSSDSSFRSNYNPNIYSSRHHLLPKTAPTFYTFSSWRWCTLICAAMRCFGGGHSSNARYSTSFARPPYQRSRSSGGNSFFNPPPPSRVRSYSTSAEPFSTFTPRKTRDNMNNITYEL